MSVIDTLMIVLLIITLLITLNSIYQHKVFLNKMNEFTETMEEAQRVQKELEKLMEQAVTVSRHLVEHVNTAYQSAEQNAAELKFGELDFIMADPAADPYMDQDADEDQEQEAASVQVPGQARFDCAEVGLLREKGWSTREIARKFNKGQDEIHLMLNLYDFSKQ